jgi:glycopeptide antibiotics resistance protein
VVLKLSTYPLAQSERRVDLSAILLLLWGLFIVYATTLPFDFAASGELIRSRLWRLWQRPLRGGGGSWSDAASNVMLFMPWGFLLAVWLVGRGRRYLAVLTLALVSGGLISGTVELIQLFAPRRYASFIDVVTNTFGSCVGSLIGWPWARWIWPIASVRIRQLIGSRPMTGCAIATAAGLLIAGVIPLHSSLSTTKSGAAFAAVRLWHPDLKLWEAPPGSQQWSWAAELLVWLLTGGIFALAVRESGWKGPRAIGLACGLAGGLSIATLAIKSAIPGAAIEITSVAVALAGSALGAAPVAQSSAADGRRWIIPALLIWGLAMVVAAWNPPQFAWPAPPFWKPEMIIPFWSYFDSRGLADLADLMGQVLYFVPLGALLAARSWRWSFPAAVGIGLALGLVLEYGQVFIRSRTADVTDVISSATGAGLGLALWRWGEWARNSSVGVAKYRVGHRAGLRR